jgi:putative exporter of polyketide antibiotics
VATTRIQLTDLESSFGEILKKEFGTGIPQIATVIAVVLGSLGLKPYFDAGAWTVIAVLCFALVFLYRHQLPNCFLGG